MSSISTEGIRDYGSELSSIANNLSSLARQIEEDVTMIQDSISKLQNWNGMDASEVLQESVIDYSHRDASLFSAPSTSSNSLYAPYQGLDLYDKNLLVHYYKYVWNIEILNNQLEEAIPKLNQVQEQVNLLDLEGNDLIAMSERLDHYIADIEAQLGTSYASCGNLTNFFNSLKNNSIWEEYKETAKQSADLKKTDLLYLKYRSKEGTDDYVDFLLDEIGNHRMQTANSTTKYGYWYMKEHPNSGMTAEAAYCAAGVSYAMEVSGNAGVISPYINVSAGAEAVRNSEKGQWHDANDPNYLPQRGDIFYKGGEHTGIVLGSDENYLYTIEANTSSDAGQSGYVNTRVRVRSGDGAYITNGGYYTPDCYIHYSANDSNVALSSDYLMNKLNIQNGNNE